MSRAQELLDAATPLPWVVQVPGDNDIGAGTVFIDTHAYPDGPEPVIAATYPLGLADAQVIAFAVNALPAYEAARQALEELLAGGVVLDIPGKYVEMQHDHRTLNEARIALAALRDEVPV